MILGVFIEFFGVKIVIGLSKNHCDLILSTRFDLSQNSRYISEISDILPIYIYIYIYDVLPIYLRYLPISNILPIYLRYLPIFYRYVFINSNTCTRET